MSFEIGKIHVNNPDRSSAKSSVKSSGKFSDPINLTNNKRDVALTLPSDDLQTGDMKQVFGLELSSVSNVQKTKEVAKVSATDPLERLTRLLNSNAKFEEFENMMNGEILPALDEATVEANLSYVSKGDLQGQEFSQLFRVSA